MWPWWSLVIKSKFLFSLHCTRSSQDFEVEVQAIFWSWNTSTEAEVWSVFSYWGLIEVIKFNLGRDSEAGCGWDSELMLGRDSEDEIWTRFCFPRLEDENWFQGLGPRVCFAFGNVWVVHLYLYLYCWGNLTKFIFSKCIYIKSHYIWIYRNCICWVDNELSGKRKNLSSLERELTSCTLVPRSEGKLLQVNF